MTTILSFAVGMIAGMAIGFVGVVLYIAAAMRRAQINYNQMAEACRTKSHNC